MSAINPDSPGTQSSAHTKNVLLAGLVGLLLLGAFLRFFQLGAQKLWLDEIYIAQLVESGLGTIWQLSFVDILAPLSTLPFWVAAQVGGISAISLRAVSVIASMIALAAFARYCTRILTPPAALTTIGLFSIAPLAVYYAQEARPYSLGLMSACLTFLAYERLRRKGGKGAANWVLYAAIAVIATQSYYLNTVLIAAQLLVLLLLASDRLQVLKGGLLTVVVLGIGLIPFLVGATTVIGNWKRVAISLSLLPTLQTMLVGDARIAPHPTRVAALAVFAIGLALAVFNRRRRKTLLLHALQIGLAIFVSFVLLPLIGKPAPAYDERAFLMLLPSALIVLGIGIEPLMARRSYLPVAVILVAVFVVASSISLRNYFGGFNKSPEAQIAEIIAVHSEPGDQVFADRFAYSPTAALQFYVPELDVCRYTRTKNGQLRAMRNPSLLPVKWDIEDDVPLGECVSNTRLWLVYRGKQQPAYYETHSAQYTVLEEYTVVPYRAILVNRE